jgi:hypothetical protein
MSNALDPHVTSATVTFNPQREAVLVYNSQRETAISFDTEHNTGIVWAKSAVEEYQRMSFHVAALASAYGPDSPWAIDAAQSFAKIASSLTGWGNIIITRDGELSLFCRTRGENPFVFGLIFHSIRRFCHIDGCPMFAYDDGSTYHYKRTDEVKVQLHKHRWIYALDAPKPGTWSFHS